ncbi:MAG: hypothetical protein ACLGGV_05455 [Bacteroidia bacterium]
MTFPQYRKYPDNRAFFKILSDTEFEELSFIGTKQIIQKIVAKTYTERLYISDMISNVDGIYHSILEAEYLSAKNR